MFRFPQLPRIPTEEELRQHIATIAPLPAGVERPFWSVMIPTYNRPEYLRQALESVLTQDPGPDRMQIQVSDNFSTVADIEALVRRIGRGRVEYYRQPKPFSDNWTTCIRHSRGQWIHLLHDDDMVLPGFYSAYERVIAANPRLVMVGGRAVRMDKDGQWTAPANEDARADEFFEAYASESIDCGLKTTTVAVKRDAYERLGGLCDLFTFCGDTELWLRIAMSGPFARTGRRHMLYREHPGSDFVQRVASGIHMIETYLLTAIHLGRLRGRPLTKAELRRCRSEIAARATQWAWILEAGGSSEGRLNLALVAWMLEPRLTTATMLAKSWIKHRLWPKTPSPSEFAALFDRS